MSVNAAVKSGASDGKLGAGPVAYSSRTSSYSEGWTLVLVSCDAIICDGGDSSCWINRFIFPLMWQ